MPLAAPGRRAERIGPCLEGGYRLGARPPCRMFRQEGRRRGRRDPVRGRRGDRPPCAGERGRLVRWCVAACFATMPLRSTASSSCSLGPAPSPAPGTSSRGTPPSSRASSWCRPRLSRCKSAHHGVCRDGAPPRSSRDGTRPTGGRSRRAPGGHGLTRGRGPEDRARRRRRLPHAVLPDGFPGTEALAAAHPGQPPAGGHRCGRPGMGHCAGGLVPAARTYHAEASVLVDELSDRSWPCGSTPPCTWSVPSSISTCSSRRAVTPNE